MISSSALPAEYGGDRNASTCIYYLLTPDTFSAIHRVKSDEIFHFYAGDAVEMLQFWPNGEARLLRSTTISADRRRTAARRARRQSGKVADLSPAAVGHSWVAPLHPGFDYADFELAEADDMLALRTRVPQYSELITALTTS